MYQQALSDIDTYLSRYLLRPELVSQVIGCR